jgi:arginyl-tRNA synthetase
MQYLLPRLKAQLLKTLSGLIGSDADLEFSPPSSKINADLSIPLFKLAKTTSQNPAELALELSGELKKDPELKNIFTKIEPLSGFINFTINPTYLAKELSLDLKNNPSYGSWPVGKEGLVIVDYIGLNMAKPFSVGHLRPTLQGQALINLYRALGYQVIGDTHLGDSGTPFGIWVVGFKLLSSDQKLAQDGAYELGRVYAQTKQLIKDEEAAGNTKLKLEAAAWLKKLEAEDPEALAYQQKFNQVTQSHMFEVLEELGVHPDQNLGESFFLKRAKELTTELIKGGVATKQADGSVIVGLDEFNIDTPILLQKSDGSALYATTDIATIEYRVSLNNYPKSPSKIIYSTDLQQRFHFQQVFALAQKLGLVSKTELMHAWFGQTQETGKDGKRQKMSSRSGAMYIRDLIDRALEFATKLTAGRRVSFEDIHKIAIGAVKFNDFAGDRRTNILFDWDRMFSLQGFSGPFIQYAAVRINSILAKLNIPEELNFDGYSFEAEKDLLIKLSAYPEVVLSSAQNYEPHHLASYAFELAQQFNRYYEAVNVNQSSGAELAARIWTLKLSYQVLESSLGLLGIQIPTRM